VSGSQTQRRRHFDALIETLSPEGRGVTHIDGKATFVDGALPGEFVRARYRNRRRRFDEAEVTSVLRPSAERTEPGCPHFGVCGGCRLQHLDPGAQIGYKQAALMEQLRKFGDVRPEAERLPLTGPVWGYRHKARLGVKYVDKKEKVLVGFRERDDLDARAVRGVRVIQ